MSSSPVAVAYLRVSTDQQADSGLGLEAQRAALTAAAGRLGLTLSAEFVDAGVSGSTALSERPGLLSAVDAVKRGDVVLVAKRDRLGRDVIEVGLIERLIVRKGARVVSAAEDSTNGDDPVSVLMRRIVDAFGEYERLLIGQRTKAALRAKRARGERAGTVPFGYLLAANGQTLALNPDEQTVLELMRRLRAMGATLQAIASELNAQGFRTRRGTPWSVRMVHHLTAAAAA